MKPLEILNYRDKMDSSKSQVAMDSRKEQVASPKEETQEYQVPYTYVVPPANGDTFLHWAEKSHVAQASSKWQRVKAWVQEKWHGGKA